jgi:hypothetical protein
VVAFVAFKLVDMAIGLRVPEEEEREGLDITSHGETAYCSMIGPASSSAVTKWQVAPISLTPRR